MKRNLLRGTSAASCYFRSSVDPPNRKALLQITERCNLFCAHCFVSAGNFGDTMAIETIKHLVIPRLKQCHVISVTLTGGEPFAHPDIIEIVQSIRATGMEVSICTNATITTEQQIETLAAIGNVHINVSLDGFRPESHGKFRGDKESFNKTIETIELLSRYGLLKGLLVTPNNLADIQEYTELCSFAIQNDATYVLMNPLSKFGRGVKSTDKLSATDEVMNLIRQSTSEYQERIELVNIRFPNESLPLAPCEAGNIIYVFTRGEVAICPYLVFAAKSPNSKHDPKEFIVGNIIEDAGIANLLDEYKFHERYDLGANKHCNSCQLNEQCGKGCPAAVISTGQEIEQVDREMCPVSNSFEEDYA